MAAVPSIDGLHFPEPETHLLHSTHVGQCFQIQVAQPPGSPSSAEPLPVLYATDGNEVFDLFQNISRRLQLFGRDVPPFILVTIGYPGRSPLAGMRLRV